MIRQVLNRCYESENYSAQKIPCLSCNNKNFLRSKKSSEFYFQFKEGRD